MKQLEDKENEDDTHVETDRENQMDKEDNIVEVSITKIHYIIFVKWKKCCWHDLIV